LVEGVGEGVGHLSPGPKRDHEEFWLKRGHGSSGLKSF